VKQGLTKEEIDAAAGEFADLIRGESEEPSAQVRTQAIMVHDYLSEVYSNRIPEHVFRKKCAERGLSEEEIDLAIRFYARDLVMSKPAAEPEVPATAAVSPPMANSPSGEVPGSPKALPTDPDKATIVFLELKNDYRGAIPKAALYKKCLDYSLNEAEVQAVEKIYARTMIGGYNKMVTSRSAAAENGSSAAASMSDVRLVKLLESLKAQYGSSIPLSIFLDRCREMGLSGDDLAAARQKYEEFTSAMKSLSEIRYTNSKAFIILQHLKKSYPGKIPFGVFEGKCNALGIPAEEIDAIARQAGSLIERKSEPDRLDASVIDEILASPRAGEMQNG